jgi:hypothetical protein
MYGEHSLFVDHCPNTDPKSSLIFVLTKFKKVEWMKKENNQYPDFNIENDNDLEIKKLEIELRTRKELREKENRDSDDVILAKKVLQRTELMRERKELNNKLDQSREWETKDKADNSDKKSFETEKIKFSENPEPFLKKRRPFQYIEEMDIQKRAGRFRKIINWWKKGRARKVLMVNMELKNGNHRSFIVYTSENGFVYNKARYLFDNESSYYNVDFRFWCFDYHEDFTLPIKRIIPLKKITDQLSVDYDEIENLVNPNTAEKFVTSEVAKAVMSAGAFLDFLKNSRMLWIIELIVGIINFLLLLNLSGVFDKLKGG